MNHCWVYSFLESVDIYTDNMWDSNDCIYLSSETVLSQAEYDMAYIKLFYLNFEMNFMSERVHW